MTPHSSFPAVAKHTEAWKDKSPMAQRAAFISLLGKLIERDPATAVHALETLEEHDARAILRALPAPLAVSVVQLMHSTYAVELLKEAPPELFAEIVEKLDPQQGAALFLNLPTDKRESFLEHLTEKTKTRIAELLQYPEDSVGRIMSSEFHAFHMDVKVKDAVRKMRSLARKKNPPASYVYVVDHDQRLVGIINMRDILVASPGQFLEQVMRTDVVTIHPFLEREEAASLFARIRYFSVPVVDSENRMLGVVKADQLLSEAQEGATEDLQKMFGAGGDERVFSSISFSLRNRLPWLHINLATAFLAASVVGLFEDLIARITVLAVFLPVVAGQGGNAGAQSLAVVMRGLVMREIPRQKVVKLIGKESLIGVVNGLIVGLVTALVVWVWHGNPYLGLVLALAMLANLAVAGFAGALIPIAMKAAGFDPAQSSSIVLTTVTDVVGFFSFLGIAVLFQAYLV
jgi:magnesium transporter